MNVPVPVTAPEIVPAYAVSAVGEVTVNAVPAAVIKLSAISVPARLFVPLGSSSAIPRSEVVPVFVIPSAVIVPGVALAATSTVPANVTPALAFNVGAPVSVMLAPVIVTGLAVAIDPPPHDTVPPIARVLPAAWLIARSEPDASLSAAGAVTPQSKLPATVSVWALGPSSSPPSSERSSTVD